MKISSPLLEELRIFRVVVRKQSLAGSALELGVSNALVSKRIAILEKSLIARRVPKWRENKYSFDDIEQ